MLWNDARIEGVSERGYELVNPAFFYVNRLIVTDIRDEYEARIAELEAEVARLRELVWLAHVEDCTCEICTAVRATQPEYDPAAIICCICNKPIEDLDNRHWLHRVGCNGDWCDCDYECCADCCPVCSGNNHDGYWCDLEGEGGDE